MPELRWLTPIYHPNISEIGLVCLGGYGTHWVPSLHLDDLCNMLWDMARYHNYDIRSPYNREAALWAANQTTFAFPTDPRPLRDRRVARAGSRGTRGPPRAEVRTRPIAARAKTVDGALTDPQSPRPGRGGPRRPPPARGSRTRSWQRSAPRRIEHGRPTMPSA